MPRILWPLRNERPTIPVVLTRAATGQDFVRHLLADTGAGTARSKFELILEETDCLQAGGSPEPSVLLVGAYLGTYPVYLVRVQIPALGFDQHVKRGSHRRVPDLGVSRLSRHKSIIAEDCQSHNSQRVTFSLDLSPDPQALLTILGQCLLVGLLLGLVFGRFDDGANSSFEQAQKVVNLLFLVNVSCFWFGCNNAAKELVKERVIYSRERDFNLRIDSYYASKFVVLMLIALIQVTLLFRIVKLWCDPPGSALEEWLSLVPSAVAGTTLGMLLSAFARTEEVAVALVPIAVIPQIILAGVITPLSGVAEWLARALSTVHWSERLLESCLPKTDLQLIRHEPGPSLGSLAVLSAHMLLFVLATLLVLRRQGQRGR